LFKLRTILILLKKEKITPQSGNGIHVLKNLQKSSKPTNMSTHRDSNKSTKIFNYASSSTQSKRKSQNVVSNQAQQTSPVLQNTRGVKSNDRNMNICRVEKKVHIRSLQEEFDEEGVEISLNMTEDTNTSSMELNYVKTP